MKSCGKYLKRCIEWNLGSSVSLSRPIEVCRLSLGKAVLVSSSESRSLKIDPILLGRLMRLPPTLDCVAVDSDVSRLFGLGVTMPPPSTEIGMINSLGDFLIGCLSPPDVTVDVDCMNDWVGVVSDSLDSLVDWRDSGFLNETSSLMRLSESLRKRSQKMSCYDLWKIQMIFIRLF